LGGKPSKTYEHDLNCEYSSTIEPIDWLEGKSTGNDVISHEMNEGFSACLSFKPIPWQMYRVGPGREITLTKHMVMFPPLVKTM